MLALAVAAWDSEAGLRTWLRLRGDLSASQQRIEALRGRIAALDAQRERLRGDPFAIESAIRRDLGLARPGEVLVHLSAPGAPGLRKP